MEKQIITIPQIELEWSEWFFWKEFLRDVRTDISAVRIPQKPGVYEARLVNYEERLTIGKASNLRMRVKQGLVKGLVPHSTGERIRGLEIVEDIEIRWAITDRPSAVEEELHKLYKKKYLTLPKYTKRT